MEITTVVFDAYGTLFDTADGSVRATREILLRNGVHLDAGKVYERWKEHHMQTISGLSAFLPEELVFIKGLELTYRDFGITGHVSEDVKIMLATLRTRSLFPDALPCVGGLKRRFEVVIVSNTDSRPFLENLQNNRLVIDRWFTSESLRAYKPNRTFYERMLSRLAKEPHEIVFVGDTLDADVLVPSACGMHGVWLNRKREKNRNSKQNVMEISTLSELQGIVTDLERHQKKPAERGAEANR
jgi:2-haloalkanoic acid dehalogenase type II